MAHGDDVDEAACLSTMLPSANPIHRRAYETCKTAFSSDGAMMIAENARKRRRSANRRSAMMRGYASDVERLNAESFC